MQSTGVRPVAMARRELAGDDGVGLVEEVAALGMAEDHGVGTALAEHRRRDLAGERARRLVAAVLRRHRHFPALHDVAQERVRRRHDHRHVTRVHPTDVREVRLDALGGKVHLPVGDEVFGHSSFTDAQRHGYTAVSLCSFIAVQLFLMQCSDFFPAVSRDKAVRRHGG